MKHSRRQFVVLAGAAAASIASNMSYAATYPAKPVRILVGFPAGSTADIIARLVAQSLSARLAQPFIVENRPGAGSNIATETVVHAAADGYTLLLVTSPNAVNGSFNQNLSFDFVRDIAPVSGVGRGPFVVVVNPAMPVTNFAEFVAYAKANPGKINMASSGNGTTTHVAEELLKMMAGINMIHVPYHGEPPALTDLMGGQVQMMFVSLPPSIEHIKAGRLRALAVTTAQRSQALPDVPAVAEFVPGFEASGWEGIGAPRGTPADIVDKLHAAMTAALADTTMQTRFSDLGVTPLSLSPADFAKLIADETAKWAKVIQRADIRA
jgi:tripartite-type tricarboxylate transporter receptor subunit TctC